MTRPAIPAAVFAAGLVVLSGCGDSVDSAVRVHPARLDFEAIQGDAPPPPQDVRVEFGGDVPSFRLVAETAEPAWLSVEVISQFPGEMVLRLAPIGTALAADVFDATLRLTMRPLRSGRPADSVDVPVALRVRAGMRVPQLEMVFQSIDGAASPHRGIGLTSDVPDESWSTAVEYTGGATGWLVLPTAAGSFQDGTAQLVLGVGYAPPGYHSATVVVRDRIGVVRGRIPVVYVVRRTYEIL